MQSSVVLPVGQIVSGGPLCSACEDTSPAPPPMVILGQRTSAPIGNSAGDGFVDEDYHHRGRLENSQGSADARGQDDWWPSGSMGSHDHASVG